MLIHIEFQTWQEAGFSRRMNVYNHRLEDRYNRLVVSLALLGDDNPDWRPDRYRSELWGCRHDFQFPVRKLLDYAADLEVLEANANPFATIVLAHLKTRATHRDPTTRQVWKLRLVKSLYERGLKVEDVRRLFRFIDWVMELPKELEGSFLEEMHKHEEDKRMPYITPAEKIWLQQGIEKGRHEERQESIRRLLNSIRLLLKSRFGDTGLRVLPEIEAVADVQVLEAVQQALETAASPEALRPIYQSR